MIAVLAATTNEPNVGWGKLIGLLVGGGLTWLILTSYERYKTVKNQPLSPIGEAPALEGVKPQANTGADPNMTPSGKRSTAEAKDLDTFVQERVSTDRPSEIIKVGMARFRKSEATVKRAIRRARKANGGQS